MDMRDLTLPYCTPEGFELPFRDPYGVPHGTNYVPFNRASDMNIATRATFAGVKVARTHEACSLNEARAIASFNFNPYVVDIREQYPVYSQDAYNRARVSGKRMARSRVMTYDVVLTFAFDQSRLHYHGVSIKDASKTELSDRDKKRMEREETAFAKRGWTWQMMLGDNFSKRAFGNHMLMRSWIGRINIYSSRAYAKAFATRLSGHSLEGSLNEIVARNARYMGISRDYAFTLFGIAVSLGYLYVDHREELRVDRPLTLLFR
ncbi:TnsA endonuclease N-terminal domain-containing protein [Paraburkholderia sp. 22B1P]|uniref:TnsA endonuclease N-terminal domain-containing protein n=1 Tax=Paraburkholderia sp. 22B1P TaxID=3080498 RepID=UPI0030933FE1|nr:TnsA endonuclease N-terminal domain-containing protein [Paraburkholderia sp. 22B1P]